MTIRLAGARTREYAGSTGNPVGHAGPGSTWNRVLTANAPHLRLETDDQGSSTRTITGTITSYNTPSSTQGVVIHDGALNARQPLDRVKLLRDHDQRDPVGYMSALDAAAVSASFYVPEGENGDRALLEAEQKLRDGLSIGFAVNQYAFDDDYNLHVYEAELYEVSLCAIPDMADAGVTDVAMAATTSGRNTMNREQLAAALAAGTISQEVHDRELAKLSAAEPQPTPAASAPPVPPAQPGQAVETQHGVPAELAAGPTPVPAGAGPAFTRSRELSLRDVSLRLADQFRGLDGTDDQRLAAMQLALQDITPAQDAGKGFVNRADWAGELWTASAYARPWIDAIGAPQELSTMKRKGFRWTVSPTVAEYSGNKAEVPTSPAQTEEAEYTAFRVAAAWDFDRIFEDLASTDGYIEAFFARAVDDYKVKSDKAIRDRLIAAAVNKTTTNGNATVVPTTVIQLLKQIVRDGRKIGGSNINRIFLGEQLFSELEDLQIGGTGTTPLPLWLKDAQIGVNAIEGNADVSSFRILYDSNIGPVDAVYFDNRAITVREKAPFQVRALDVAHAGIDVALYSYLMLETPDPRLIMKRTRPAS